MPRYELEKICNSHLLWVTFKLAYIVACKWSPITLILLSLTEKYAAALNQGTLDLTFVQAEKVFSFTESLKMRFSLLSSH